MGSGAPGAVPAQELALPAEKLAVPEKLAILAEVEMPDEKRCKSYSDCPDYGDR